MRTPALAVTLALGISQSCPLRAQDEGTELAKQLSNPISSLISVPFQSNWDFRMGPLSEGTKYTLNFQPVVPLSIGDDWNLIIRTIVPYVSQEDVFTGPAPKFPGLPDSVLRNVPVGLRSQAEDAARAAFNRAVKNRPVDVHQDGMGDIVQSFFFSPKAPTRGGLIWGVGPAFLYPTATDSLLGGEKWGVGPTFVLLKQSGGWTYGMLANHLWSFAGDDARADVNATFVQPFISYTTKKATSFTLNTEATYDWNNSQWLAPVNLAVGQVVKLGKLPVQFTIGGKYYAEGPSGAPEWGLRFVVTPLFPKGAKPAESGYAK